MKMVIEPNAGDHFDDQIDIVNMLLEKYPLEVGEVELNFNGEKKYMRTVHDTEQIKKFIWSGYKEEE